MEYEDLLVHYWQLPEDLFVSLNDEFHKEFCIKIQRSLNYFKRDCFSLVLFCKDYHALRLFNREIRFRISEIELLRERLDITKKELERNIQTIGNQTKGTIIKNPKLPFNISDLVYVVGHLMFDGCFRPKRGCYFYSYGDGLLEYHKRRLSIFGEVPTNFMTNDDQLYFSYTIGYIASKVLEISDFRSIKIVLSEKFKNLVRQHKILLDEFLKAAIIDEGAIGDEVRVELGNESLINDIYQLGLVHYKINKPTSRERFIYFKDQPHNNHYFRSFKISFSAQSNKLLYESISPLPISYKQKSLYLLYTRRIRDWGQRKRGESKKLIVKSLLQKSKSVYDLSYELNMGRNSILDHLKKKSNTKNSLYDLGIVEKVSEEILAKGGYAKVDIYGIKDKDKAEEYISKEHY